MQESPGALSAAFSSAMLLMTVVLQGPPLPWRAFFAARGVEIDFKPKSNITDDKQESPERVPRNESPGTRPVRERTVSYEVGHGDVGYGAGYRKRHLEAAWTGSWYCLSMGL